jgi:hypothetical protein
MDLVRLSAAGQTGQSVRITDVLREWLSRKLNSTAGLEIGEFCILHRSTGRRCARLRSAGRRPARLRKKRWPKTREAEKHRRDKHRCASETFQAAAARPGNPGKMRVSPVSEPHAER